MKKFKIFLSVLTMMIFSVFSIDNVVYAEQNENLVVIDEDDEYIKNDIEYLEKQEEYIRQIVKDYRKDNEEVNWKNNLHILQNNYSEIINKEGIDTDMIDDYISIYEAQEESEKIEKSIFKTKILRIARTPNNYYKNYNRSRALDYALTYFADYNPEYPDWNSSGGDCANFASQCLHYGGIPMVGSKGNTNNESMWYSYGNTQNLKNVSATWILANSFKNYWMQKSRYYYRYENYESAYNVAKVGDIIQLITSNKVARHTYIVVGKDSNTKDLILACHSANTDRARLSNKYNSYGGGYILYSIK